jgi:hypothetical protein
MKLFKITKNKSLHFKMSDGRIGIVYESGYVRVSVKGDNSRLYQINQKKLVKSKKYPNFYDHTRILVNDHVNRVQMLYNYDLKNCQL